MYDSIHMKYSEWANQERQKVEYGLPRARRKNGSKAVSIRPLLGVMKIFQNYIMVTVTQLCKYTKNHWIVHFKGVNFVIYKCQESCEKYFSRVQYQVIPCGCCLPK